MGAIDPQTFEIEFIERTQGIINNYDGEHEFSLLISCLLSLIVLTCERIKTNPPAYFNVHIGDVVELHTVVAAPTFLFEPVNGSGNPQQKTLANFLKRMRHSLAHATVYPVSVSLATWTAVEFICENKYVSGHPLELRAFFEDEELRAFAIAISTLYQKEFLGV